MLAHVKRDAVEERSFAAAMARPEGDRALVSDVRFLQILRSDDQDIDHLMRDLLRVVRQLKGAAPVHRVGEDLWWWNEWTRRRWAIDYFDRTSSDSRS